MYNDCIFSEDRKYRYVLRHIFNSYNENQIAWIGLNPSTADEKQLDPTLRRIKGFSEIYGFGQFYMLNLFALRSTDPSELYKDDSPIGPDNDKWLVEITSKTNVTVCCWGSTGTFMDRGIKVLQLLNQDKLYHLTLTNNNQPIHPLYVSYEEGIKKIMIENNMLVRSNETLKKLKKKGTFLKW